MDAMDMIDRELEAASDRLYEMQYIIKRLESKSTELYERKLDMIVKGYPEDRINQYISNQWEIILSKVLAKTNSEDEPCKAD